MSKNFVDVLEKQEMIQKLINNGYGKLIGLNRLLELLEVVLIA